MYRYFPTIAICVLILVFAVVSFRAAPPVSEIDYASVVFEGWLTTLPLLGLFLVVGLRDSQPSTYWTLLTGLTLLGVAMATDTLDEMVELPGYYNPVFEGLGQVLGFTLLLLALNAWMRWNETMKTRLHTLATTDYLTGVPNRRHFIERLQAQIYNAERYRQPLSVILMDLDRFKQVNDRFGHETGDEQLVRVATLVKAHVRKADCFARYGGEEFVLLTPQTALHGARAIAEKLRVALEASDSGDGPAITASFGVAQFEPGEMSADLLKRADHALYQAKAEGRNRVA